jgi:putative nucleotidyltransferase with HDIG domain
MSVLGDAIAKRDNETNAHNYRVTLYAIKFAEVLGVSKKEIQALIKGAFLHDVGKIGIPDGILLKPGKLTRDEFETMKQHVLHGLAIISRSKWLEEAKNVIEFHHEHYDGKGYLKGLRAEEIPLNARIFMICDVFDAFTSKRPYKEAFPLEESMHMIQERAGTHFDPKLVEVFLSFIADFYLKIANLEDLEALELHLDEKIEYLKL